ncbi:MAG: ATP synthase F1 subunit epsilon [Candidatus Loosdrechtia sp.]|uniref:F0F1 ATP synthase subunit epsilon n=1 Tax=Candidatus Loosdrechtia sp. TaxID=3101272 RepID=UPI003A79AC81|nr:MAG: ATP synthase F1 subunit epsilon [Candidatus Jettenia sp. AMX2]
MAKTFQFEIITPEKLIFSGAVQNVSATGTQGAFSVLADHAPFITELKTSIVTIRDTSNKTIRFALDGGFFEVMANNVIVLTDACVQEGNVDVGMVQAEKAQAEQTLAGSGSAEEKQKAQNALNRANTWLSLTN